MPVSPPIARHSRAPALAASAGAVWPPPVVTGARVGVAALSGPVEPTRLDAGLTTLRELGFEPVLASNAYRRDGLFAGPDEVRLAGFHELAADPSLAAIFFVRGGHGVLRLLPRFDWRLLRRYPRAYVGYSDVTPLLLAVVARLGLVAFHGPMVATDLGDGLAATEAASLLGALGGGSLLPAVPVRPLAGPAAVEGTVDGVLLGGCLTLLAATLGTRWRPRLRDAILFLEDVAEPAYRVDRMLVQLQLAGALEGVRALVVGHLSAPPGAGPVTATVGPVAAGADAGMLGPPLAGTTRAALADFAARTQLPTAVRAAAGHGRPNLTLPLGARVTLRLAGANPRLELPQPAVETETAGAKRPSNPRGSWVRIPNS